MTDLTLWDLYVQLHRLGVPEHPNLRSWDRWCLLPNICSGNRQIEESEARDLLTMHVARHLEKRGIAHDWPLVDMFLENAVKALLDAQK